MPAAGAPAPRPLSTADLARYGAPGLALAVPGLPLFLLVPAFFVDERRLDAAAVGAVLLLARLLDLVADPLAGHACRSASSARRLQLAGAVALLAGTAMLFLPPAGAGLAWLFAGALVAHAGWTLVQVPVLALGATLPRDDADRARLAVSREGFVIAGLLLALALPVAAGQAQDTGQGMAALWVLLACVLPPALLLAWPLHARAAWGLPVPLRVLAARSAALFRDAGFRALLLTYFINALANAVPATLLLLYVAHVLEAREATGWLLAAYLLAGIAALPAWLWLARRIGAARAWLASMAWAALVFACVPLLGAGDQWLFLLVCAGAGLSVGADNALPAALQARQAARLRALTGEDDAGLAFGWWGMATKVALAAGAALALASIDAGGFRAGDVDAAGRAALVYTYGLLPVLCKLLACVLAWRLLLRPGRPGGEAWNSVAR